MTIVKTDLGQQVMKDRSVPLTPRQRSALILVDGRRTLTELQAATAAAGVPWDDLEKLFDTGLVRDTDPQATAAAAAAHQAKEQAVQDHKQRTPQQRYAEAYPIATQLTAGLGLRGFRLNLAVEAAGSYEALVALAPKIKEAVGAEKFQRLESALNDR